MLTEKQKQALKLYADYEITLIQAVEMAEMGFFEFQALLRDQRIPQHYTEADFEQDVAGLRQPVR
jgi:predicted HTH domain antitoxin